MCNGSKLAIQLSPRKNLIINVSEKGVDSCYYKEHHVKLAQRGDVHLQILALLGYHYLFDKKEMSKCVAIVARFLHNEVR
jgi:hypothetical protein